MALRRDWSSFGSGFGMLFCYEASVTIGILECFGIVIEFLIPFFRITIISKILVPTMRESWLVSGLEWTPIAFCTSTYLDGICKESIHIATVETISFLHEIEIVEESSLIYKILTALHIGDTIECECCILIYRECDIEDNRRNNHPIDKRNREEVSDIRWYHIPPTRELHGLVLFLELLEKYYFFLLKVKSILLRETIVLFSEFSIEGLDFCEDIADSVFHSEDISFLNRQRPWHGGGLVHRACILFQILGLSYLLHLAYQSSHHAYLGPPQNQ